MVSRPTCRHCVTVVHAVKGVSEPTFRAFLLQWCRLFKRCQNLPARHCVTVVQAVYAVVEPTCRALCYSGAGCLSSVRIYLLGTVLQGCRLLKKCQKLPARHCVTVVQTVKRVSEPTCRALCYSDADCLSGVGTYLPGTE